jgi:putative transposase
MARRLRNAPGGVVYHVLNRAVGRGTLFADGGDYAAFEKVLGEACARFPGVALLAYCLMPNHWHLVLRPRADGELSAFVRWLTVTHAQRWHAHHGTSGTGPLYQGRFKSFPVQSDGHFLIVCRYVERNAVRAGLAASARAWRRCSAAWRGGGPATAAAPPWLVPPARWPVDVPGDWDAWVDRAETPAEVEALRRSVARGAPFGSARWVSRTAGPARPAVQPPPAPPAEEERYADTGPKGLLTPFAPLSCSRRSRWRQCAKASIAVAPLGMTAGPAGPLSNSA